MQRDSLDRYYTPEWAAETIVDWIGIAAGDVVLEPHVGGGSFARALRKRGAVVFGCDVDEDAPGFADCDERVGENFLNVTQSELKSRGSVKFIIANPPFKAWREHAEHALRLAVPRVVFLLRMTALGGADGPDWWASHNPTRVGVLSRRPSFSGSGNDFSDYVVVDWGAARGSQAAPALGWIACPPGRRARGRRSS